MRNNSSKVNPPVREGEEVEVTIESVGGKGDGVARVKGFVIFIPNAKENTIYKIRITKVLAKVGFGEIIKDLGSMPEPEPEPEYEDSEDFGDE